MNVNVHVFICDVIVYIACHLPLTHLLGIIVQFNKFYSILFYSMVGSRMMLVGRAFQCITVLVEKYIYSSL